MRAPSFRPLLSLAVLAAGFLVPGSLPAAPAPADHELRGVLLGPDGAPVPDATIRARLRVKDSPILETGTDARGRWRLEGLAAGTWVLQAGVPGSGVVHQRLVDLPAVEVYPFMIHRDLSVRGRLFDEATGLPAAGVPVFQIGHCHRPGDPFWAWTVTDAEGRWHLDGVNKGVCADYQYVTRREVEPFRGPRYADAIAILRRREVISGDLYPATRPPWVEVQPADPPSEGSRAVSGIVVESDTGSPVPGAVVEWVDGTRRGEIEFGQYRCVGVTDGQGRFRAGGLFSRGHLRVRAPLRAPRTILLEDEASGDGLRVALEPEGPPPGVMANSPLDDPVSPLSIERTIRGRVLDEEGRAVPGVSVEIGAWRFEDAGDFLRRDRTDAEGRFVFFGVPAGVHPIRIRGDTEYPEQSPVSAERGEQGVILSLKHHPALEGRVVHPDGSPAAGVGVVTRESDRPAAVTGPDGAFHLHREPGNRKLTFLGPPDGFARAMTVNHPAADPLVVTLLPAGTVRGRIVDPNGQGVPGAEVEVDDLLYGSRTLGGTTLLAERPSHRRKVVTTDAEGRFAAVSMDPAGTYSVNLVRGAFGGRLHPTGTTLREGVRVDEPEFTLVLPQ